MIRDWAGLDSSSDDVAELNSVGPGEVIRSRSAATRGSGDFVVGDATGIIERRVRPTCSVGRMASCLVPGFGDDSPASLNTAVLADVLREMFGRADVFREVAVVLPSLRGIGESRRMDRAEAVRKLPPAADSEPGIGEGAAEPFAAAVAFRT